MEDLPIHKAVEELITVVFLEQKRQFISDEFSILLDIKSSKVNDENSQLQLFKIKLFCVRGISDISTYLKEGFVKTLQFVVEKMQSFLKNESHLCQIEMHQLDSTLAIQRNYFFIKNLQNKTTDLSEITQNIDTYLQNQAIWYLRIYQNNAHMMGECSKILDFLKKFKILNPLDEFKYKLNISGIKCNPNLTANNYIEICDKKIIVGLHENIKRDNSGNTYIGTTVPLTLSNNGNINQNIFSLTCLAFTNENLEGGQDLVQFFSFGPNGEPLKTPQVIPNFVSWGKYGQKASLCSSFENTNIFLKPDVCLTIQPNDRNIQKSKSFGIIIYMIFDSTDKTQVMDLHILGHLHTYFNSFLKANEGNLRTALESLTDAIFRKDTSDQNNTRDDCLSISESITNIVRRSTNEEFRESCLLTMKSSTMQQMQSTIAKRLRRL